MGPPPISVPAPCPTAAPGHRDWVAYTRPAPRRMLPTRMRIQAGIWSCPSSSMWRASRHHISSSAAPAPRLGVQRPGQILEPCNSNNNQFNIFAARSPGISPCTSRRLMGAEIQPQAPPHLHCVTSCLDFGLSKPLRARRAELALGEVQHGPGWGACPRSGITHCTGQQNGKYLQ